MTGVGVEMTFLSSHSLNVPSFLSILFQSSLASQYRHATPISICRMSLGWASANAPWNEVSYPLTSQDSGSPRSERVVCLSLQSWPQCFHNLSVLFPGLSPLFRPLSLREYCVLLFWVGRMTFQLQCAMYCLFHDTPWVISLNVPTIGATESKAVWPYHVQYYITSPS